MRTLHTVYRARHRLRLQRRYYRRVVCLGRAWTSRFRSAADGQLLLQPRYGPYTRI